MKKIIIGTRGSDLALYQANYVKSIYDKHNIDSEIKIIISRGDKDLRPLKDIAGDGFFTKELEHMLISKEIDIAVHSAKDLPSLKHAQLPWLAIGPRETTKDILVCKKTSLDINKKPLPGSVIGTSSPRRKAQLIDSFSNIIVKELRGNVPTRLKMALTNGYDGVVLAKAGVLRLGLLDSISEELEVVELNWTTAPCQGIIAVQSHMENTGFLVALKDDKLTEIARIEKSILAFLGGGCHMAIGANITTTTDGFTANYFYSNKKTPNKFSISEESLEQLKLKIFPLIVADNELIDKHTVIFTQSISSQYKASELAVKNDLNFCNWPLSEIYSKMDRDILSRTLKKLESYDSLVFSSKNAAKIFLLEWASLDKGFSQLESKKIFAIGSSTKSCIEKFSVKVQDISYEANGSSFSEYLKLYHQKSNYLFIGTNDSLLLTAMRNSELNVDFFEVYSSEPPTQSHQSIPSFYNATLCFSSPSAVENCVQILKTKELKRINIAAIGPSTSKALKKHNLPHIVSPISGSWESLLKELSIATTKT